MPLSTIGSNQITDGAIAVADVADGSISTAKLADNAVTTAKITDDAVTTAKVDTNIAVAGTLGVTGQTTLSDKLTINFNGSGTQAFKFKDTGGGNLASFGQFYNPSDTLMANIQNANNDGIHIMVGNNGSLVFDQTGFNATNALDDYEQGAFTPTAGDGNTTYNTQHGFYTKIGEMVHAQFNIAINSFGGSTRFAMGGLPFTSKNTSGSSGIGTITYFNSIHTSAVMLSARNDANTSAVYISGTTGNGGTMANINHNVFQNGTNVFGAIIYRAS